MGGMYAGADAAGGAFPSASQARGGAYLQQGGNKGMWPTETVDIDRDDEFSKRH